MPSIRKTRHKLCVLALLSTALLPASALAQDASPSDNLAVNVVRALVEQGVLSKKQAQAILAKAEADTQRARAVKPVVPQAAPAPQEAEAPVPANVQRVPYIPDNVREEIAAKVRDQVLAEEESKNWAKPDAVPGWTKRIHLFGDVRVRDEERLFDKNNADTFVNIAQLNAGSSPVDQFNGPFPVLNSTQNRNLLRLRARLGLTADIGDDFTATIRFATGSDNSPVSTNQTFGGYFNKKSVWLDQAFIDYQPIDNLHAIFGRMPNPFRHTEIVWDDDVNPDGLALTYSRPVTERWNTKGFLTVGGFPISYAPDDFPTTAPSGAKVGNNSDKWLIAAQAGVDVSPAPNWNASFSAAYYHFFNAEGSVSPCIYSDAYCFTDFTRPGFAQKGNTYLPLRPDVTNPSTGASPEFYGLASQFHVLDLVGQADYAANDRFHLTLTGDIAKNLGFDRGDILARAGGEEGLANNNEFCALNPGEALPPGANCDTIDPNTSQPYGHYQFRSGDLAWLVRFQVGAPKVVERWQWNVALAYAYLQPDAVLDAFTDSDFRLGGTNSKGWILGGNLGLAHNAWLSAKWLSADAVDGPPFSVDVVQLDLNVKF